VVEIKDIKWLFFSLSSARFFNQIFSAGLELAQKLHKIF